jgi:hypothetical protein
MSEVFEPTLRAWGLSPARRQIGIPAVQCRAARVTRVVQSDRGAHQQPVSSGATCS